MGYTHYFPHKAVTHEVWEKILIDCRKLFRSMPETTDTAGGYNKSEKLQLSNRKGKLRKSLGTLNEINFNGYPEDLGHEMFEVRRSGISIFTFCKTAREPYDLMVCACLIVYCFHSRETMDLSSDGDWDDWEPAMRFVGEVLGQGYVMKFKMEQKNF